MAPSILSSWLHREPQLGKEGKLKLGSVRHFVLDECDKMLDKLGAGLGFSTLRPVRSIHNMMLLRSVACSEHQRFQECCTC